MSDKKEIIEIPQDFDDFPITKKIFFIKNSQIEFEPKEYNEEYKQHKNQRFKMLKQQEKQIFHEKEKQTVRWRKIPQSFFSEQHSNQQLQNDVQSNAKFIEWSDGSYSIIIGDKNYYDIQCKKQESILCLQSKNIKQNNDDDENLKKGNQTVEKEEQVKVVKKYIDDSLKIFNVKKKYV